MLRPYMIAARIDRGYGLRWMVLPEATFSKTGPNRMASIFCEAARATSSRVWQEMVMMGVGRLAAA